MQGHQISVHPLAVDLLRFFLSHLGLQPPQPIVEVAREFSLEDLVSITGRIQEKDEILEHPLLLIRQLRLLSNKLV